jgi:hypothetical protein
MKVIIRSRLSSRSKNSAHLNGLGNGPPIEMVTFIGLDLMSIHFLSGQGHLAHGLTHAPRKTVI